MKAETSSQMTLRSFQLSADGAELRADVHAAVGDHKDQDCSTLFETRSESTVVGNDKCGTSTYQPHSQNIPANPSTASTSPNLDKKQLHPSGANLSEHRPGNSKGDVEVSRCNVQTLLQKMEEQFPEASHQRHREYLL